MVRGTQNPSPETRKAIPCPRLKELLIAQNTNPCRVAECPELLRRTVPHLGGAGALLAPDDTTGTLLAGLDTVITVSSASSAPSFHVTVLPSLAPGCRGSAECDTLGLNHTAPALEEEGAVGGVVPSFAECPSP